MLLFTVMKNNTPNTRYMVATLIENWQSMPSAVRFRSVGLRDHTRSLLRKLSVERTHDFGTIWCAYGCMGSKLCLISWFCWEDWDLLPPEKNSSMSKWGCWRKTDWTSSTRLGFCGVDPSLPKKLMCLRLYGIKTLSCIVILWRRMVPAAIPKRILKWALGYIQNDKWTA